MAATIRLLQYNNYYNRIVKKEDSIEAYAAHVCTDENGREAYWPSNTNFIVRDGVDTVYVANWQGPTPDYLLVTDSADREIVSRWFVVEANYSTIGQSVLTLHRDLVVDFYEDIVNAPTFIEKATLRANDPFIFNSENITFNQIKKRETLIEDNLSPQGVAWLCGYLAADAIIDDIQVPDAKSVDIIGDDNIPEKQYLNKTVVDGYLHSKYGFEIRIQFTMLTTRNPIQYTYNVVMSANNRVKSIELSEDTPQRPQGCIKIVLANIYNYNDYYQNEPAFRKIVVNALNSNTDPNYKNLFFNEIPNYFNENSTDIKIAKTPVFNNIINQDGKIVQSEASSYKKINVNHINTYNDVKIRVTKNSALYNNIIKYFNYMPHQAEIDVFALDIDIVLKELNNEARYMIKYTTTPYTLNIIKKVSFKNRGHLQDQPFDMFCIPYPVNENAVTIFEGDTSFQNEREIALDTCMEVIRSQGKKVFDVQLLPYCPMREIFTKDSSGNNIIDIKKYAARRSYIFDSDGVTKRGVVLFPNVSKTSFNIEFNYPSETSNAIEKKVNILTKMHRLCSPGYNSMFEFNAEKNGGIPGFTITCDFKPISPFIHISPIFSELYGKNFGDMRGLTCTEDFSITRIEDAFVQFELQNKNYQRIFNREIQHLEDTHDIRMTKAIIDTVSDAITGGIAIGASHSGSVASGVGFGAKQVLSGAFNIGVSEKLHNMDLEFKKDKFGYQLDNIRALPETIAKISAFCQNNKIFPVLEEYGATPVEEQALRDKLKYNGMSVHRIGTIREFLEPADKHWIQGTVIRLNNLVEDYHLSYAIALEINNGVYI